MRTLAKAVHDYVALRRALGFKMVEVSYRLDDFARFARQERASRVTVDLAVRWAKLPATVQPATWAVRRVHLPGCRRVPPRQALCGSANHRPDV
jgi:hypothetical protein